MLRPLRALALLVLVLALVGAACDAGATDAGSAPDTSSEPSSPGGGAGSSDAPMPGSTATTTGAELPEATPGARYLAVQEDIRPVTTPRDQPVVWGSAPVIDEHYGGTLYQGTAAQMLDPRPPAVDGMQPLRLWVSNPNDGVTGRPAIIWFHGGGFAVGLDSMYGQAKGIGAEYASRGYVSFAVEYRIDTTLIGDDGRSQRPPSLCQWVQDNQNPSSAVWRARLDQCQRNIVAAREDALAAVRWVRAHAAEYGVDPDKVAVGGFSAGAVMASDAAYLSEDVGTHPYWPGDVLSAAASEPQAAFGVSGCTYSQDEGAPQGIGPGDAPTSFIHSEKDSAVPYDCIATTVTAARAAGLVAELTSYCGESGHAAALYTPNQAASDEQWTTFLARELHLYRGLRPPSADPLCP